MDAQRAAGSAARLSFILWHCLGLGVSSGVAQETLPSLEVWPSRSLILRGQEPDPDASDEAEFPEVEPLETDRDSFTPATTTVGRGRWIAEAAYSFIDNRNTFETHSFPESLLRYGASERIELRFGWNYEIDEDADTVSGGSSGGSAEGPKLAFENQLSYGLKLGVSEQAAWRPRSALIVQGFTPTGGPATTTDLVASYVVGWELPNRWQLDSAMRYGQTSEHHDHFNQWAPSIVLKVPVADRWNAHIEYFGFRTDGRAEEKSVHYFSPGVHYRVTPDLEVGFRFGWGLNDDSPKFFNNVGVGWRF